MPKGIFTILFAGIALQMLLFTHDLAQVHANIKSGTTFHVNSKPGKYTCPCGRSFQTKDSLAQHIQATGHDKMLNMDSKEDGINAEAHAARTVNIQQKLHKSDSIDRNDQVKSNRARRSSLDKIEKDSIAIDKYDKKSAVAEYSHYVRKIIDYIRRLENGKIYSADIHKAGSYAANTKVGKADEFDTNIVMHIDVKDVRTEGVLTYIFKDKKTLDDKRGLPRQMNIARQLKHISNKPEQIPHGSAVVQVKDPSVLTHLTHEGDLIPHKVLQDLHTKVKSALYDLGLSGTIDLSPTSQGPALTITIKQHNSNDISVDLVPSLSCALPVTMHGWPRKSTRSAYTSKKIEAVIKAGLHLVPKWDETWTISYSKAERELLDKIDDGNECRRGVMRLMKSYLEQCKQAKASKGLSGLSSHIIKTQLLWSSEKRTNPGWWHQKQKDKCVLSTIDDMLLSIESGKLLDYFDTEVNILAHKQKSQLKYFANCLRKQKVELENFGIVKDEL